jgi:hypothetical protein
MFLLIRLKKIKTKKRRYFFILNLCFFVFPQIKGKQMSYRKGANQNEKEEN